MGWGGEKRARPGPIGIDLKRLLRADSGRQRCSNCSVVVALPSRQEFPAALTTQTNRPDQSTLKLAGERRFLAISRNGPRRPVDEKPPQEKIVSAFNLGTCDKIRPRPFASHLLRSGGFWPVAHVGRSTAPSHISYSINRFNSTALSVLCRCPGSYPTGTLRSMM